MYTLTATSIVRITDAAFTDVVFTDFGLGDPVEYNPDFERGLGDPIEYNPDLERGLDRPGDPGTIIVLRRRHDAFITVPKEPDPIISVSFAEFMFNSISFHGIKISV
jgi:hypothetical protein